MSDIVRHASAQWNGTIKEGSGTFGVGSGVIKEVPYTFAARFETAPGTNPEELIGAAHAACFTMNLTGTLGKHGFTAKTIDTTATVTLSGPQPGGRKITKILLTTRASVEGIDAAKFAEVATEAEQTCPISNALRAVTIELDAALV